MDLLVSFLGAFAVSIFEVRCWQMQQLVDDTFCHKIDQFPVLFREPVDMLSDFVRTDGLEEFAKIADGGTYLK